MFTYLEEHTQKYRENKENSAATITERIVYLILAFPLGLIYFLITIIGLSVGLGTLILWVGLPILFGTLFAVRGMATLERQLAVSLLHTPIPYRPKSRYETPRTFMRIFGDMLHDPYTWMSLLYMLVKLPLGIVSFTFALVLPVLSAALALLPLAYLTNLFINLILLANGIHSTGYIIPYFLTVQATFDPLMFMRSFVTIPIGILLWFATRFILRGFAIASGELVRVFLGPGEMMEG